MPLQVSPTIISHLLRVPRSKNPIAFPIHKLTLEQKGAQVERLCGWFMNWSKMLHKDYRSITQVLHKFFTYNILPTTNQSTFTNDLAYLIDVILNSHRIDLLAIVCYMMIRAYEAMHPIGSLRYPTLITQIMQTVKVPFKVAPKGHKDGRAVRHNTLCKMGLIEKNVGSSSLTPGPS